MFVWINFGFTLVFWLLLGMFGSTLVLRCFFLASTWYFWFYFGFTLVLLWFYFGFYSCVAWVSLNVGLDLLGVWAWLSLWSDLVCVCLSLMWCLHDLGISSCEIRVLALSLGLSAVVCCREGVVARGSERA